MATEKTKQLLREYLLVFYHFHLLYNRELTQFITNKINRAYTLFN